MDKSAFDSIRAKHVGTLSMTMDNKVSKDDIKSPITDEEISPVLKKVYTVVVKKGGLGGYPHVDKFTRPFPL